METKAVRGTKVLLPSEDETPVTSWSYGTPLEGEDITNTEFRGVDLSSHRWEKVTLSRVAFYDSRMMGFTSEEATLNDVLFEGCQFDYAALARIRIKGSVIFVDCRFREAVFIGGDWGPVVFEGCSLAGVELDSVKMKGTDIRGCEVPGITGVSSLKGAQVSPGQLPELFDSFAKDLELNVSEA